MITNIKMNIVGRYTTQNNQEQAHNSLPTTIECLGIIMDRKINP